MKKFYFSFVLLLVCTLAMAQNTEGDRVISLKAGFSTTGLAINNIDKVNIFDSDSFNIGSVNAEKNPAISATFDYAITDRFSLGGIFSTQSFTGNITDYKGVVNGDTFILNDINFKLNRMYLGVVPKLHWSANNDKVDFYSAVRVGFVFWVNKIDIDNDKFKALDSFKGGRPAVGAVPIGVNIYFTDSFGANAELSIGAPYIFSLGGCYKF